MARQRVDAPANPESTSRRDFEGLEDQIQLLKDQVDDKATWDGLTTAQKLEATRRGILLVTRIALYLLALIRRGRL